MFIAGHGFSKVGLTGLKPPSGYVRRVVPVAHSVVF
jgi:hypothetical protein